MCSELTYMDYAYNHLLQHMDNGSSRFAKFKAAKIYSEPLQNDAAVEPKSSNQQSTEADMNQTELITQQSTEDAVEYRSLFEEIVLNKGDTITPTAALNCVRESMQLMYSSEQETFRRFQSYFHKKDHIFAAQFKNMLDNKNDPVIKWMKYSLVPFGKELLNWCGADGESTLNQSLHLCNGNSLYMIIVLNILSNAINTGTYLVSSQQVFSDTTVNLVKEYVLKKFPSRGTKRNSAQSSYDYNSLRHRGYLKANENQAASANTDRESCVKGGLFIKFLRNEIINKYYILIILNIYRNKNLL